MGRLAGGHDRRQIDLACGAAHREDGRHYQGAGNCRHGK